MNLKQIIRESVKQYINENNVNKIDIYHGTPFEKNAIGIKNKGLQQVGDFIVSGGDGSPAMNNRSYVAKELWNAIRYSFFKPDSIKLNWNDYIKNYPYGYVFHFQINLNDLLPDEDAIGQMVNDFLNQNKYKFLAKYLKNIDKDLLNRVKEGEFKGFAEIGKIIEPKLEKEDKNFIINNSKTYTINKPIKPIESFKIKKPNSQFFNNTNDYIVWFNKHKEFF